MNLFKILSVAIVVVLSTQCKQLPRLIDRDSVVAVAGGETLMRDEVAAATPANLVGKDSTAYVERYVERWIIRQLKVSEAARVFSSSVHDIESMVRDYRHSLLTRKLEQYYINSSPERTITDEMVRGYYNAHEQNFILDRSIVKGRILRIPIDDPEVSKLQTLMRSQSSSSKLDLKAMSEKSESFEMTDFTDSWVEYDKFIDQLPVARDVTSGQYISREGVQRLQDGEWSYLFEIEAYRTAGHVAPLERVDGVIRKILLAKQYEELIRQQEQELYKTAEFHNYLLEKDKDTISIVPEPVLIEQKK